MSSTSARNPCVMCGQKSNQRKVLIFHGVDGMECEDFIHAIHERAFDEGKQQDNEWMASLAQTSFVGLALRWYASLDAEVQDNWRLLRQALLIKYPSPEIRASSAEIPVAAPSNPAPSCLSPAPSTVSHSGVIRLVGVDGLGSEHVSKDSTTAKFKDFNVTCMANSMDSAAIFKIRFIPSASHYSIRIQEHSDWGKNWLGVHWDYRKQTGVLSWANTWGRCPDPTRMFTSAKEMRSSSQIWTVDPDGTLVASWDNADSTAYTSVVAVRLDFGGIWLVKDYAAFVRPQPDMYYQARLVFELST